MSDILSLPKFGDGVGLHRIRAFMDERKMLGGYPAGSPRHGKSVLGRSLVIVGSKGKGSTARLTAALLAAQGRRTGCFTSPHMFDVRERFRIGDDLISQDDFDRLSADVLDWNSRHPAGDRLGAFEALFLVALLWFDEQQPDRIVWEAGIGGRYDPVRALEARYGALTSVELEHTELLGHTEELIAFDKMDAFAPGGSIVISPCVPAALIERMEAFADLTGRGLRFASRRGPDVSDIAISAEGTDCTLSWPAGMYRGVSAVEPGSRRVRLGLIGRRQIDNMLTALVLARMMGAAKYPDSPVTDEDAAALAGLRIPGRLERVARDPDLWIDVAHTPHSIDQVTQAFLEFVPRENVLLIFGASANKKALAMADIAASRFDRFVLTRAFKAGADPAGFAQAFSGKDAVVEPDLMEAVAIAQRRAVAEGLTVLALGGLFLAAEVQTAWRGGDPRLLEFL
jgi:dihydrofolate synthase / folylpolyglutamate synthase